MKKLTLLVIALILMLVGCSSDTEKVDEVKSDGEQSKSYKIGIIKYMDHVSLDLAEEGFVEKINSEGKEVEFISKSANADMNLISTIVKNFEAEKVDIIYAIATPSAQTAKNLIKETPIVFSSVTDPVGAGLVESFKNSPDSNVTGVSDYVDSSKQIDEFLKLFPDVKTFGVIYNTSEQNSNVQVEELEKVLESKGIKLEKVGINNINDIPLAITSISNKIDAFFAITDNMVASAAPIVSQKLIENNIPSLSAEEGQVRNGLLISQGVDYKKHGIQAGELAIRILNGEEVSSIEVENNKEITKLVNESTAKALKIDLDNDNFKDALLVK